MGRKNKRYKGKRVTVGNEVRSPGPKKKVLEEEKQPEDALSVGQAEGPSLAKQSMEDMSVEVQMSEMTESTDKHEPTEPVGSPPHEESVKMVPSVAEESKMEDEEDVTKVSFSSEAHLDTAGDDSSYMREDDRLRADESKEE